MGAESRRLRAEAAVSSEALHLVNGPRAELERGVADVQGEKITYDLYAVDARSDQQRALDEGRHSLEGNLLVLIPGHGQTARGPSKLIAAAAALSKSKVVWSIDITPAREGDRTEAGALAQIVGQKVSNLFPTAEGPSAGSAPKVGVTLLGWSHGGGEALLSVESDPDLFLQVIGLCPTGLVSRRAVALLLSFVLEATRILWRALRQKDWVSMGDAVRMGANALRGLVRDVVRSRSLRRILGDIEWASAKAAGGGSTYAGEVVLLFGDRDTVVRWQDVFPNCSSASDIAGRIPAFRQALFPRARRVEVLVVEGSHLVPETRASSCIRQVLGLLGQLDETAPWGMWA